MFWNVWKKGPGAPTPGPLCVGFKTQANWFSGIKLFLNQVRKNLKSGPNPRSNFFHPRFKTFRIFYFSNSFFGIFLVKDTHTVPLPSEVAKLNFCCQKIPNVLKHMQKKISYFFRLTKFWVSGLSFEKNWNLLRSCSN